MKQLKLSKRYHRVGFARKNSIPQNEYVQIYKDFEDYENKNYKTIIVKCLCNRDESYIISTVDREGMYYPLVICKSCGLIRAKEYWDEESTMHYYANWYRKKYAHEENPNIFYEQQVLSSKRVWNFMNKYISKLKEPMTIVDIGGGAGGVLDSFKSGNNCYVFDFNKPFLKKANDVGYKTIEGGIDKLNQISEKPDLVILSHVVEHFTNVHLELETLKKYLKLGSLVYIELPGIDSLNEGRREYDLLSDIHKPHVFYFSVGVLNNLMERYGFKCLKSSSLASGLYEYTGEIGGLINNHDNVISLISRAELKRKLGLLFFKKILGIIMPRPLKDLIKNILIKK